MELSPQNVMIVLKELSVAKTEELVFHLGIEQSNLNCIAQDFHNDDENCKIHFIKKWINMGLNPSWKKLISGLKRIRMNDLATSLESTFGMCNVICTTHTAVQALTIQVVFSLALVCLLGVWCQRPGYHRYIILP